MRRGDRIMYADNQAGSSSTDEHPFAVTIDDDNENNAQQLMTRLASPPPLAAAAAASSLSPPPPQSAAVQSVDASGIKPQWPKQSVPVASTASTPGEDRDSFEAVAAKVHAKHPLGLMTVKDVDGVQLIVRRHHVHSTHASGSDISLASVDSLNYLGLSVPAPSDSFALAAAAAAADANARAAAESRGPDGKTLKPLKVDTDPQRYRLLVKGVIPLRPVLTASASATPIAKKRESYSSSSTDSATAVTVVDNTPYVEELPKKKRKGPKKSVKFSDEKGYQLSVTRNYENQDEAPDVPLYATAYLKLNESNDDITAIDNSNSVSQTKILRTCFTQPGALPDFLNRVHTDKVALEFCIANDQEMSLTGTIRVANIDFHKKVIVRYSLDHWRSKEVDVQTSYVFYSHDGDTDRFAFDIRLPATFNVGDQLEFAVCYDIGTATFWDSNKGENYRISCHSRSTLNALTANNPAASPYNNSWLHYL